MKITQFKKMLSIHGADLSRWDDIDPDSIKGFIASSEQAAALYKEAQALDSVIDSFTVPDADPVLLDRVMNRIGGQPEMAAATVHHIKPKKSAQPMMWGGAAFAMAAAVILFVYSTAVPVPSVPDVNIFLAELDSIAAEDFAAQEIIGLWELAEAKVFQDNEALEKFLDELFDETEAEPDLWEL